MRFLNWDVLLFPHESRIPIQEFDVKCHALSIPDSSQTRRASNGFGLSHRPALVQIPNLTGFVPSLQAGQAFRVSIHSWERPKPSAAVLNLSPAPDRIVFEAKVYIDGRLQSRRYLREMTGYPQVINTIGGPASENARILRFPPFHPEILQQSYWDARDGLGRIRVVIAEGIARSTASSMVEVFDKVRDVVAFSFQHAPRNILEDAGIAWPNARMFQNNPALAGPSSRAAGLNAHAHLPQRHMSSRAWHDTTSLADDPFLEVPRAVVKSREKQTDRTMLDAPRNRGSGMSGIVVHEYNFQQQINQAAIPEIVRSLTPSKREALLKALVPTAQQSSGST